MTLANLSLTPERAMLLTDTLVVHAGRPWSFCTKFALMAHCAAVVTARGPAEFRKETAEFLEHVFLPAGAETAAAILPNFLADLQESIRRKYPCAADLDGEVLLAGWSPSAKAFRAWHFSHANAFEPEVIEHGTIYLPRGPGDRPGDKVDFGDKLLRLARHQHQVMVAETPPGECCTVGGDLISVDLTGHGMTVRKVARLPGYEDLAAAMRGDAEEVA